MEEWRWIENFENEYAVSNLGNVYSYLSNQYKKATKRKDGYYVVTLKEKTYLLHRLVLESFVGPPPTKKHECRHFPDTDKSNNKLENLSWSTHIINEQDKEYVLSDEQVIEVKNQLMKLKNYKKVAELFELHIMTVSQIARGLTYKNIGPDLSGYNFDSRNLKSDNLIRQIKQRINENIKTPLQIMKEFGINRSYFYRIKNGELRKDIV